MYQFRFYILYSKAVPYLGFVCLDYCQLPHSVQIWFLLVSVVAVVVTAVIVIIAARFLLCRMRITLLQPLSWPWFCINLYHLTYPKSFACVSVRTLFLAASQAKQLANACMNTIQTRTNYAINSKCKTNDRDTERWIEKIWGQKVSQYKYIIKSIIDKQCRLHFRCIFGLLFW